jgi:DUF4097 and DUF4098 domain-containing protein YvlB
MNKAILILCFSAGMLLAQDGEKVAVPLHDPSRPATVQIHLLQGGITVRGADIKDVEVETRASGGERRRGRHERPTDTARADGLKKLELPGNSGLDVVEDNNLVTIKTSPMGTGADLVVTVPKHTSLKLKCLNGGDIVVEQVDGEIDADNLNGKVTMKNVSGSVVAHSLNGSVTASLDRVDASKPMSFSTMNGDIDVTLPDSLKANVRMKTDNGEIYSDFDVNLSRGDNVKPTEAGRQPDGTYRIRFDHTLKGTINGGGPEFQFTSFNGQIYIRRKK